MSLLKKQSVIAALIAIPAIGLTLPLALAQPANPPRENGGGEGRGPGERRGGEGRPRREMPNLTEEERKELREHPQLGMAIRNLKSAKEHLEKAPHDFGGHKVAAVKACNDAIEQLKEALKFDAKNEGDEPGEKGERKPKKKD